MALEGALRDLGLAEVIQLLASGRRTGALRVSGGPANPLSDVRVRRALREAIDYRRLISIIPGEECCHDLALNVEESVHHVEVVGKCAGGIGVLGSPLLARRANAHSRVEQMPHVHRDMVRHGWARGNCVLTAAAGPSGG